MVADTFSNINLDTYDEEQARLMGECCILVDKDDHPTGAESKKVCHLMTNIDRGLLHRAFSVFLFDQQNRLLLQQRSEEKITFPGYWTNTCCSHPLYTEEERVEEGQLGVRRAAQRKLEHELGIPISQVPLDQLQFLTRIHYKAPSDEVWGEHEIDYVLFFKADVDLQCNPNEVQAVRYVTQNELREMLSHAERDGIKVTPWFRLIANNMLFDWWEKLEDLTTVKAPTTIHRY